MADDIRQREGVRRFACGVADHAVHLDRDRMAGLDVDARGAEAMRPTKEGVQPRRVTPSLLDPGKRFPAFIRPGFVGRDGGDDIHRQCSG
ncbi:hypothetical protein GLUCOINTEAF2_0204186 [Komagataeibacter intermedius AF2]|uniref:Uncharacterized protein n=1 Tax=Komagataeibacter intermedius AF2 TaxID=1458464 RepID=A0A0N1FA43_9PROT|nr:hypothetical protein GLUCOINTEAF2_0204186 [Komagataeibacter intermedius AF2]